MDEERIVTTEKGDGVDYPNFVRRCIHQKVAKIDEARRAVTHMITTDSMDREGDVIEPGGADLANYSKNPIVMVGHRYDIASVVGRASDLTIGQKAISATTEFRTTPLAEEAFALAKDGLGGWSIGFRSTRRHRMADGEQAECPRCMQEMKRARKASGGRAMPCMGMHIVEWELIEYSIVSIPANQDVVQGAMKRGLVSAEHCDLFFSSPQPSNDAAQGPNAAVKGIDHVYAAGLGFAARRLAAGRLARAIEAALESMK